MRELDAKYCKIGAINAILTNKANSIATPRWAKPLIMSGQFRVKSFVPHKRTAHDERFGFERRAFRYRSRPQAILPPTSKIQHPTSALAPILANKANSISAPRRAKPLIGAVNFELSRLFLSIRPLRMERFGFERSRFRYRSRPQGILPPTSKIQHPTSAPTSALDLSLWSYVIVVSIQYEASIQSFFLRVQKEGV
jgi:hypothetical protein